MELLIELICSAVWEWESEGWCFINICSLGGKGVTTYECVHMLLWSYSCLNSMLFIHLHHIFLSVAAKITMQMDGYIDVQHINEQTKSMKETSLEVLFIFSSLLLGHCWYNVWRCKTLDNFCKISWTQHRTYRPWHRLGTVVHKERSHMEDAANCSTKGSKLHCL